MKFELVLGILAIFLLLLVGGLFVYHLDLVVEALNTFVEARA